MKTNRDSPSSPGVKASPSSAVGVGLIPGQGTKIPHASWQRQNKAKHTTEAMFTIFSKDFQLVHMKKNLKTKKKK